MARPREQKSGAAGLIIIGSIVLTIAMANPVFFFAALLFVWIFGDKL